MATLVVRLARATRALRGRCNLLVIGGDLDDPSPEEAGELARIRDLVAADASAGAGLLLAGHRPNATATTWLAAAREGRPGMAAPGGIYVCASLKEEFGIAILEAMTVGLVVVAPDGGGPATYVDDGVTGVLADTAHGPALVAAIARALDLSASTGATLRNHRSRAVVRERFGIDTMAAALGNVYRSVASRDAGEPGSDRSHPMTLLVISPDYASHLYPLATLATAWRDAGERVVVATGPATDAVVRAFGYEREHLQLGRGSNPGVIRAEEQPPGEDDSLRGFFAATREGAVAALALQARARGDDLLWNAVGVAGEVRDLVDRVRPDAVLVDHLAFGARLGLVSAGVPHADVVLGHPSALTVGDEVYGYPPAWPRCIRPDPEELAELRALCIDVRDTFTAQWNGALAVLDPGARPSRDAFAETGDLLLLNYPGALHDPERTALLPAHTFLGSAVREEPRDAEVEAWLARDARPVVYVSLGSFLSARADVLAVVAEALRGLDVRVALATGSAPAELLGPLPPEWLVRAFLPQVRLLAHGVAAVTHGGNNSVTEALTAGVPLLVLPLSTDQFAGAAAVERGGVGLCLDPNAATPADIRAAVRTLLSGNDIRDAAAELGRSLREVPGAQRAYEAVAAAWPAPAPPHPDWLRG